MLWPNHNGPGLWATSSHVPPILTLWQQILTLFTHFKWLLNWASFNYKAWPMLSFIQNWEGPFEKHLVLGFHAQIVVRKSCHIQVLSALSYLLNDSWCFFRLTSSSFIFVLIASNGIISFEFTTLFFIRAVQSFRTTNSLQRSYIFVLFLLWCPINQISLACLLTVIKVKS